MYNAQSKQCSGVFVAFHTTWISPCLQCLRADFFAELRRIDITKTTTCFFYFKGKSCSRRKLPTHYTLVEQYYMNILHKSGRVFGGACEELWDLLSHRSLTHSHSILKWWANSSEANAMKNNEPPPPVHRRHRDKKGTENEGKCFISKEPRSFRGTAWGWPCALTEPAEWFIKTEEESRLQIGAPSLCLTDKEAPIKAGSSSLKWLPYLAKWGFRIKAQREYSSLSLFQRDGKRRHLSGWHQWKTAQEGAQAYLL